MTAEVHRSTHGKPEGGWRRFKVQQFGLSEDPSFKRCFSWARWDGWEGDIQVSRRRRRSSEAPGSSPRLPEAPQNIKKWDPSRPECINQAFMHVFFDKNCNLEPQILPNHMNFRWKFIHARHSAAVCVFPRAIFRAVDSFLDPFIPKC